MNVRTMSHTSDPSTSSDAAAQVNPHDTLRLKLALIDMLDDKPGTGDELIERYLFLAELLGWPPQEDIHNVKRRLSQLHTVHHVIRHAGKRPSAHGRAAHVWELAVSADEARRVVNGHG